MACPTWGLSLDEVALTVMVDDYSDLITDLPLRYNIFSMLTAPKIWTFLLSWNADSFVTQQYLSSYETLQRCPGL